MPLYARAAERYMPRCWNDAAGLADRRLFTVLKMPEAARSVLLSLDGASDFESYAFTNGQRAILRALIRQGFAEACEPKAPLSPFQRPRRTDGPYLREIHWAVTGRCNLNCRHCFMESPVGRYPEPSWAELERVAGQIAGASVPFVSLTGGEPLLHPDIRRLVMHLSESGISISQIVTNGTLLDDSFLKFLRDAGQKPAFQISYDGAGRHDLMRGAAGAEKAALRAIERCVAEGCVTAVTSIFNGGNIDSLMESYERLKAIGVTTWMISRAQTAGLWHGGPESLTTEEMGTALLALQQRWLEDGKPMHMLLESFYEARPRAAVPPQDAADYSPESLECPETQERIFLLPDGRLLPCPGFAGTGVADGMPNLRSWALADALNDSPLTRFCRDEKSSRLQINPECAACGHFAECGMGCRAYALTEGGSLDGPDLGACEMYRGGWRRRFAEAERRYGESGPSGKPHPSDGAPGPLERKP